MPRLDFVSALPRVSRILAAALLVASACAQPQEPAPATPPPPRPAHDTAARAPQKGVIAGQVLGPDGRPAAGALVAVISADGSSIPAGRARSGPDGRFRIENVPPGEYGITATTEDITSAYLDVFQLAKDSSVEGLTVKLGGEGFTLEGKARARDGRPLREAWLIMSRMSSFEADLFTAPVREDGSFRVRLPSAAYQISVMADGYESDPVLVNAPPERPLEVLLDAFAPADVPAPAAVVDWLKQNAVALKTVEAGSGLADMAPIKAMVGKARVVSLGEATHGSREFFQLKHRMLELLVTEMGFTSFAIEASFPEALRVNEYVLTGKGDPEAALTGMRFWTWDTEEVLALIRWMRRYNEDHKAKLKFYGFDMQSPPGPVGALVDYIRKVDRAFAPEVEAILAPLSNDFDANYYTTAPPEVQRATASGIARIIARLDAERAAYEKRGGGADAFKLARLHAQVVRQGEASLAAGMMGGDLRDKAMAENVLSLLDIEGPGAKMVLWAHNAHVQRTTYGGGKAMGAHLHEALGADQVVFGFAFNQGGVRAVPLPFGRGVLGFTVPPLPAGSLDATLARLGSHLLALDMRAAPAGSPAAAWLDAKLSRGSIGSAFREDDAARSTIKASPRARYDALLFVETTQAARPTAGGQRKPSPGLQKSAAPLNLDFEEGEVGKPPPGWWAPATEVFGGYEVEVSEARPKKGKRCAIVRRDKPWPWGYGMIAQEIDAAPFRGKRVRVSAAARAEALGKGARARLVVDVRQGPSSMAKPVASASTADKSIASKDWREVAVEATVAADAERIAIKFVLIGDGRAFLDDVRVEVLGEAKAEPRAKK